MSDDGEAVTVTDTAGKAYDVPFRKADPEDENYPPILRFRGIGQRGGDYLRGDVVTFDNSAFIAKRPFRQADLTFRADDWEFFLKTGRDGGGGVPSGLYPEINKEHNELAGVMKLAVVAALPGAPDANTLYFIKAP